MVMLPGLGADARLFEPQRPRFPGIEVPRWLPNEPGETLADYARRMAATIWPSSHFYLGGVSFGGMVALEMAQYLRPAAVFLIASCRKGEAIAPHLKYFVKFAGLFPERLFELGKGATPLFISKFGQLTDEQRGLFEEMLEGVQPAFVRWGIAAITDWPGPAAVSVPVHHIHGSDDQWIPSAAVEPDRMIEGGGHMINLTHADQVNAFIAERI